MACSQCGTPGVEGICSMCYGDIDYGTDGLYRDYMERQWQEREQAPDAQEVLMMERKKRAELICPDCNNEMTDVRDDGRVYCDHCDAMFYLHELDYTPPDDDSA